jgi:hypothetical protein
MQHQSQDFTKKSSVGKTDILDSRWEVSSAEIERHIALGKQMQAEAIAAFLTDSFLRLGRLFSRQASSKPTTTVPGVGEERLSRA